MPPCRHGSGIWHRRPRGRPVAAPRPGPVSTRGPQSKPEQRTERRWRASLCFIVGQPEATPHSPCPQPGHTGSRQNHRGPGARPGPRTRRQAGASPCRRASVELDGAAVVLAVLALLLRGAHEAAQKVAWKQAPVRADPPHPPSTPPASHALLTTLPIQKGHMAAWTHGWPRTDTRMAKEPVKRWTCRSATTRGPHTLGLPPCTCGDAVGQPLSVSTEPTWARQLPAGPAPTHGRPQTRAHPCSRSQRREPACVPRGTHVHVMHTDY